MLYEYDSKYIAIANSTSRQGGATAFNKDGTPKSKVVDYIVQHREQFKDKKILDFGAGKKALQTEYLRSIGFRDVTAYDFGANVDSRIHDRNALNRKYDVIFASNVLNVSSDLDMLFDTLEDIQQACKPGSIVICNYPGSPRKLLINGKGASSAYIKDCILEVFGTVPVLVGGSNSTPVWKIVC